MCMLSTSGDCSYGGAEVAEWVGQTQGNINRPLIHSCLLALIPISNLHFIVALHAN